MNKTSLSIFGATGSIGSFALDLIGKLDNNERPEILLLSGFSQIKKLIGLQEKFKAKYIFIPKKDKDLVYKSLSKGFNTKLNILTSFDEVFQLYEDINLENSYILNGIIGVNGIIPTFLSQHFNIINGCANKESIILSFELFNDFNPSIIYPLDSEHNAIYSLMKSCPKEKISKVYITGSGGKVYNRSEKEIKKLKVKDLIVHPNWDMGKRITIDSSSGINKAFEFIEVQALFGLPKEKVNVLIDPKSQVHAIVQDINNYYYAAISKPDMYLPINMFLEKIGLNINYVCSEFQNNSFNFNLDNNIKKTYPFLHLFIENYDKKKIAGTILLFLNSYLQDLLFDNKINFYQLRKNLLFLFEKFFENNFEIIGSKITYLSESLSFYKKESYSNLESFCNEINELISNLLIQNKILEDE